MRYLSLLLTVNLFYLTINWCERRKCSVFLFLFSFFCYEFLTFEFNWTSFHWAEWTKPSKLDTFFLPARYCDQGCEVFSANINASTTASRGGAGEAVNVTEGTYSIGGTEMGLSYSLAESAIRQLHGETAKGSDRERGRRELGTQNFITQGLRF